MLKPLENWICDHCGDVIDSAAKGYVEWIDSGGHASEFKIIHAGGQCHHHLQRAGLSDSSLKDFVGPLGLVNLLRVLDVGTYHNPTFSGPHIAQPEIRPYVEVFRRLHLPYYEEARLYWGDAIQDGEFDGINEVAIFMPEKLERIVERYSRY